MNSLGMIFFIFALILRVHVVTTNWRNFLFMCTDRKHTIRYDKVCDGIADCSDLSDETLVQCQNIVCPVNYKKCYYGACVRNSSSCSMGRDKRNLETSPGACRIDRIPRDGYVTYRGDANERLHLNDVVESFSQIEYTCVEGHTLTGSPLNFCSDGTWINRIPDCVTRCSAAELLSITFVANCYLLVNGKEQKVRCTDPARPGTIAKINCQRGYESLRPNQQIIACGTDGRWFPGPVACTQVCGEEGPEGTPYIVGGELVNITKTPWHVGIYRAIDGNSFEQQCGGTILNAKVVLSAMHCFWDRKRNRPIKATEYRVVAGKARRQYDDPREQSKVQTFPVAKIHYLEGYMDFNGLYANDIALLVLKQYIEFKPHIAPICFDYDLTFDEKTVPVGWVGHAAGWGLNDSNGIPSTLLKLIELPVVSREECIKATGVQFAPFVTPDKFCAGHLTGVSVCQGDSGGGLVFPKTVNGRTIYYLRGIVSIGPSKGNSCDNDKYTTFTNTAHFADFIFRYEFENRPTSYQSSVKPVVDASCQLTQILPNGFISLLGDSSNVLTVGTNIESFGTVQYSCMENHELQGNSTNVCVNGTWIDYSIPKCVQKTTNLGDFIFPDNFSPENAGTCKITKIPRKGWIEYGLHDQLSLGERVQPNTKVKFRCIKDFAIDSNQKKESTCINGQWSSEFPDCFAVCNRNNITATSIKPRICYLNNKKVSCSKSATQGTVAHIQCRNFYNRAGPKEQTVTCGKHGVWIPQPEKCAAICGLMPQTKPSNITNEKTSSVQIPWHVGIYKMNGKSFTLECGGTIVSERVVISVAHCFWDPTLGRVRSVSQFRVVGGKTSITYSSATDRKAQYLEIKDIKIPGGLTEYLDSDIALVLLNKNFNFKAHIAPVCLPNSLSIDHLIGYTGLLPGWNFYNQFGQVNSNLQTIELTAIQKEQCLASAISQAFRSFATKHYKFCAYSNQPMRLCQGATGGGLVFSHHENGKEKFYLRGVASRGPLFDGQCDNDVFVLLINTIFFYEFFSENGGGWVFDYVMH